MRFIESHWHSLASLMDTELEKLVEAGKLTSRAARAARTTKAGHILFA